MPYTKKIEFNQSSAAIATELSYLKMDPIHQHEKPYSVNYDTNGLLPKTNTFADPHPVVIQNFRTVKSPRTFDEFGFCVKTLPSALGRRDFDDPDKVEECFYPEVKQMLEQMFPQAAAIEILEHKIRKRDLQFPLASGKPYHVMLPTNAIHIDCTPDAASFISKVAYPASAERYPKLCMINLWKSLQGPGNDWPLALCDRRTVDYDVDLMGQDMVSFDRVTENAKVYHSPRHDWYYLDEMRDDEVLVFQQFNSEVEGGGGVPHTGFFNPMVKKGAAPRSSIELRVFLYFE
ncbi:hypothetical protein KJ359_006274 [Pestalotiopsis sp. 9143b]|nr:hypothetical protein KJ359_006274 [Pestalotiopsis sp. 9143b]